MNFKRSLLLVLTIVLSVTGLVFAQTESFVGPYTMDDNTMLLLHFDSDLTNASEKSQDAVGYGNFDYYGHTAFGTGLPDGLGQFVWLDNDSDTDSSYFSIPDTSYLDLDSNWTVELWTNVMSFGGNHLFPKLVSKPTNWWLGINGAEGTLNFQSGYEKVLNGWADTFTKRNIVELDTWYHVAAMYDADNMVYMILVHNVAGELVDFGAYILADDVNELPRLNDNAVEIGHTTMWPGDSYLNGLIDEVRISDKVRNYDMPPVIKTVYGAPISHAEPNTAIDVVADVLDYNGTLNSVKLFWSDGGSFNEVAMTLTEGVSYSGTIPGQAEGTQLTYYVQAGNSLGYEVFTHNSTMSDSGAYFGITVGATESIVLDLDFEDSLYDSSLIHHTLVAEKDVLYSDDAVSGTKSLHLTGDTTFFIIEKPAAYLACSDVTIDVWVNPDSSADKMWNRAIVGKFHEWAPNPNDWMFQYRLWMNWWDGHVTFEMNTGDQWRNVTVDTLMVEGNWYHIIAKYSSEHSSLFLELYDANDNLLHERSSFIDVPLTPKAGVFAIGGDPYDYMRPNRFKGKIDNLKVYNYAAHMPPAFMSYNGKSVMHLLPETAFTLSAEITNSVNTEIHYSVNGDTEVTAAMTGTSDTYTFDFPAKAKGTIVEYYITAANEMGKSLRYPGEGSDVIAYTAEEALLLYLDFEEGTGLPVDKSDYANTIWMNNDIKYSSTAADGSYSMHIDNDTSYIRVEAPAPFAISDQMTIDIKFMAEGGLPADGTDLIAKYPNPDGWAFGFRTSFQADGKLFPELFLVANDPGVADWTWRSIFLANDTRIEADKWYRYVMTVDVDSARVMLFDASDSLLDSNVMDVAGQHLNPVSGMLTIGRSWWDPAPVFHGMIDEVKLSNYVVTDTTGSVVGIHNQSNLPENYALKQNYPNPFNPVTQIEFSLPEQTQFVLAIYNVLGQKVRTLIKSELNAGTYSYKWNGTNDYGKLLSSGVYFYKLTGPEISITKKMLFLR